MAKAKRLVSGKWRVLIFDHINDSGKRCYRSFTADTKSDAERMANKWKYGTRPAAVFNITLTDAVLDYITSKEGVLAPDTIGEYSGTVRRYIQGTILGSTKLQALTSLKLQTWVSDLSTRVSAKTVRNAYALIHATLSQQMPDCSFRVTLPTRSRPLLHTPTDRDVQNLLSAASPNLRLAILLCACGNGGLRRGEICAIRHRDIDRKNCCIHIHADLVKDPNGKWFYKDHPKTSAGYRTVHYDAAVMDLIPTGKPNAYVVGITPGSVTNGFVKLKRKLGIQCRFHDLRAYCASVMLAMKIPERYVEQTCGWTPGSGVLRRIYSRVLSDREAEYDEKASSYFKDIACNTNATQET